MQEGQKITFSGEGDQEPELEAGDVIIMLKEKEHPVYSRQGNDLLMKMDVSVSEALTGFKRVIKTLDKREILIASKPGRFRFVCWVIFIKNYRMRFDLF